MHGCNGCQGGPCRTVAVYDCESGGLGQYPVCQVPGDAYVRVGGSDDRPELQLARHAMAGIFDDLIGAGAGKLKEMAIATLEDPDVRASSEALLEAESPRVTSAVAKGVLPLTVGVGLTALGVGYLVFKEARRAR